MSGGAHRGDEVRYMLCSSNGAISVEDISYHMGDCVQSYTWLPQLTLECTEFEMILRNAVGGDPLSEWSIARPPLNPTYVPGDTRVPLWWGTSCSPLTQAAPPLTSVYDNQGNWVANIPHPENWRQWTEGQLRIGVMIKWRNDIIHLCSTSMNMIPLVLIDIIVVSYLCPSLDQLPLNTDTNNTTTVVATIPMIPTMMEKIHPVSDFHSSNGDSSPVDDEL
jgi:hypothetical protein